jgi:CBS domain-containing protein
MTVKVIDLMQKNVIFATANQPVEHLKKIFEKNKISSLPVVDSDEYVIGIVTHKDLLRGTAQQHAKDLMSSKVYTIPEYEKTDIAARIMRNHKIHHLIVTQDKKLVGILSSFDLLKLVENKRYVPKNQSQHGNFKGKRNQAEIQSNI